MWCGRPNPGPKATAAPATVSGEHFVNQPLGNREGDETHRPASQETSHAPNLNPPSGVTGNRRNDMTTDTLVREQARSTGFAAILAAVAAGIVLLYLAGFAEASVFHDAAHDTRHTLAFPCH